RFDCDWSSDVCSSDLGQGGVFYGTSGSSVRVHYYLMAGTIYRQQDNAAALPLAVNVQDFVFDVTDAGKVVTTRITFNPTFNSARSEERRVGKDESSVC